MIPDSNQSKLHGWYTFRLRRPPYTFLMVAWVEDHTAYEAVQKLLPDRPFGDVEIHTRVPWIIDPHEVDSYERLTANGRETQQHSGTGTTGRAGERLRRSSKGLRGKSSRKRKV